MGISDHRQVSAFSSPRAPSRFALPAHAADGKQNFLAIATYAKHDKQRNRRCFAIDTYTHSRSIEDQADDIFRAQIALVPRLPVALDLPPHSAHRVLRHSTAEQRRQGTPDTARVGARKIAAGDQRFDLLRAPAIRAKRLALPLGSPALSSLQSCAGN